MGREGLAVRVEPAADAGVAPDDLAVFVADEGVVHVGLEIAEQRPEAEHLLGRLPHLRPLREEFVGRRGGVEGRAAADAAALPRESLAAQALLGVVLGALDSAEGEGETLQQAPDDCGDAQADGGLRNGQEEHVEFDEVVDPRVLVGLHLFQMVHDVARRGAADGNDLLEG